MKPVIEPVLIGHFVTRYGTFAPLIVEVPVYTLKENDNDTRSRIDRAEEEK